MYNVTVILKKVPAKVLSGLEDQLQEAKEAHMDVCYSANKSIGYVCMDVEVREHIKVFALAQVVDFIDYAGVGDYVSEITIEDY